MQVKAISGGQANLRGGDQWKGQITFGISFTAIEQDEYMEDIMMKLKMREQIDAAISEYLSADESADAEWGFLKNIVNIDRFFDSGVKA